MKYTRQWYEEIVPKIVKHKNVILFQIENEYSGYISPKGWVREVIKKLTGPFKITKLPFRTERSKRYLGELYQLARDLGVKVPIFHNDLPPLWGIALDTGGRTGVVDIVGTDDYSFFGQDWKNSRLVTKTFPCLDFLEKWLRPLNPKSPLFITELQGGWFDGWGGKGYEAFRKLLGPEHIDIVTRTALAQGVTLFNYYMFCGGTSWGYLSAPCVYTSYDFGAPVTEAGLITERYKAVNELSEFIEEHEEELCVTEENNNVKASNKRLFYKARRSPKTGTYFVFLRNLSHTTQTTRLNIFAPPISVPPFSMPILVLKRGQKPKIYPSYSPSQKEPKKTKSKIELADWRFATASPQVFPDFDDSNWQKIPKGRVLDIDSLGFHYGFVWYRGVFSGIAEKLMLDARHCFTIWLNGKLLGHFDNISNLGDGPDSARTAAFRIPKGFLKEKNVLVILVESLGHNKDFEDDAKNPRGIIGCRVDGQEIIWRVKGGLVEGEKGITPVVDFKNTACALKWKKVLLPHSWPKNQEGLGLYQTEFTLDQTLKAPIGLVVGKAFSKANIYLNGFLIGRFWQELGPQHKFYLPEEVLKIGPKNLLNIVVWKRSKNGGLNKLYLESY